MKYTDTEATFNGVKYENIEKIKEVSVSIKNVQNPAKYGKWNFNIKLRPSIHFDRFTYTPINESDRMDNPDVKIRRLSVFANLKATAHTPIGAFVLKGGYGRTGHRATDTDGLDTYRTREIRKLDLSWVMFASKHIFFMIGPRYYKEQYESYVFAFRIGYFWGGSRD
ncbi:MAG: hypothetical protein ACPGJV_15515 [Bacteriovoracaceae bacterium]